MYAERECCREATISAFNSCWQACSILHDGTVLAFLLTSICTNPHKYRHMQNMFVCVSVLSFVFCHVYIPVSTMWLNPLLQGSPCKIFPACKPQSHTCDLGGLSTFKACDHCLSVKTAESCWYKDRLCALSTRPTVIFRIQALSSVIGLCS